MTTTKITRRKALQLLAMLGVSLSASRVAVGDDATCSSALMEGIDLAALRELGNEYLAAWPYDEKLPSVTALLTDEPSAGIEKLRESIQSDFSAGRMVNLSGWRLSAAEGCVIAALSRCVQ